MDQRIRCANCKHVQQEWFNDIGQDYIEVRCETCGKRIRFKITRAIKETDSNSFINFFNDMINGDTGEHNKRTR
jgi:transcription elongation factor Elf1